MLQNNPMEQKSDIPENNVPVDNMEKAIVEIIDCINKILQEKEQVIVAIDGRCASGKTTLAGKLQEQLDCNVFHMDDFFLRPEQRTEERIAITGENVDHERFLAEVIEPLDRKQTFSYRPFDCSTQALKESVKVIPKRVAIVEGSYSCHNSLWKHYDLRVFMDVDSKTQIDRIKIRNGEEGAGRFQTIWIPLEEKYFETFDIERRCQIKVRL